MADPSLSATFRKPFDEQVASWRLRLRELAPTARWDDLAGESHQRAFAVAGAIKADLLADLAAAVDRAVTEGTGLDAFRRDFRAIVERHGWHGWTGEGTARGEAWRTRVIYRTNMRTSYMAGRHQQLVAGNFRFWVYRHSGAKEPRLQHLAWDGLALPPDHPFWATHFPPNGWGCGCEVYGARTEAGIRRVGGDPSKTPAEGWEGADPRTGAPAGVDKGWGHAPGASTAETLRTMMSKTVAWPYELAKAYMTDLPDAVRDGFSRSYRALPEAAAEARRFVERTLGERGGGDIAQPLSPEPYRTMGLLTGDQARRLGGLLDRDVAGFDFALSPSAIRHAFEKHGDQGKEAPRGQRAIMPEDFEALMPLLDAGPQARVDEGRLVLSWPLPGRTVHAVFEVLAKRRMLSLKTMWITRAP